MKPSDSPSSRPSELGEVLAGMLSKYGVGRKRSDDELVVFWQTLVSDFPGKTWFQGIRRGVVEVLVADSVLVQEMSFRKQDFLTRFREQFPEGKFLDIRFRLGKGEIE